MCRSRLLHLLPLHCLLLLSLSHPSHALIGAAARYGPTYQPTACHGRDYSQFPTNFMFAAASDGTWDNGAACDREYRVKCIRAAAPGACAPGEVVINVKVVDRMSTAVSRPSLAGANLALSLPAFRAITTGFPQFATIEFVER
ncbi:EG45-like domain containing protein [Malania oleifera]|uniref:EG45-like domain containing protein n=1 Tax=Malania oleifera TaxID=397392 RepID=UPI0025ADD0E9|nr:EG45-like domain containing protein [Malania oleifera]